MMTEIFGQEIYFDPTMTTWEEVKKNTDVKEKFAEAVKQEIIKRFDEVVEERHLRASMIPDPTATLDLVLISMEVVRKDCLE